MRRFWLLLLVLVAAPAYAQDDEMCPAIVARALDSTEESCEGTDQDEVCYGHLILDAEPQPGLTDEFDFEEPGDTEEVFNVRTLRLSPMAFDGETWGVALMRVQAAQDRTGPENIVLLMFGDVEVDNQSLQLPVSVLSGANVRMTPADNGGLLGSVEANTELEAVSRTPEADWVRVRYDGGFGWVSGTLVEAVEGVLNELPVFTEEDTDPVFRPMRAFYFNSGNDDAPCEAAPNSGLLIQTPEGLAEVSLLINEVDISLNATAFLQAMPGGDMSVNVVEGEATVSAQGVTHTLVEGTRLTVPMTESLAPDGPPTSPEAYGRDDVNALPVTLLDRPVQVAEPRVLPSGVPVEGEWRFEWTVQSQVCPGTGEEIAFETANPTTNVEIEDNGETLVMLLSRYRRVDAGVYETVFSDAGGSLHRYSVTVDSMDRMSGQANIEYLEIDCTLSVPFRLDLIRQFPQ